MRTLLSMLVLIAAAVVAVKIGAPELIRAQFGALAPLVSVPLHVAAVAAAPGVDDAFGLANGILYGMPLGFALSWLAWFTGSLVQFWVGRSARSDFDLGARSERLPRWLRELPVGHPGYIIGVRFVPGAGGHLASIIPGAAGVPLRRFLWCTALTTSVVAMLWTWAGMRLAQLQG